jgi:hypothetical protein
LNGALGVHGEESRADGSGVLAELCVWAHVGVYVCVVCMYVCVVCVRLSVCVCMRVCVCSQAWSGAAP